MPSHLKAFTISNWASSYDCYGFTRKSFGDINTESPVPAKIYATATASTFTP